MIINFRGLREDLRSIRQVKISLRQGVIVATTRSTAFTFTDVTCPLILLDMRSRLVFFVTQSAKTDGPYHRATQTQPPNCGVCAHNLLCSSKYKLLQITAVLLHRFSAPNMAQFLDLPTEVRIKVYRYVFDGQKLEFCRSYEANPRGSIHWWRLRIPKSASVVGASRQLRQEAYPELIQRCSIEFAEAFVCGWVLNGINSNSLWYTTMQHAQISLKPEYNGISGSMGSVDTIRRVLGGLQNLKMLKLSLQNYFCKMTPGYKWREELSAQHLHDVFKQDLLEPGPTVLGVGRSGHGIVKNFIKAWQQLDFPCDLKTTFKVSDFVEHLWECVSKFEHTLKLPKTNIVNRTRSSTCSHTALMCMSSTTRLWASPWSCRTSTLSRSARPTAPAPPSATRDGIGVMRWRRGQAMKRRSKSTTKGSTDHSRARTRQLCCWTSST